MTALRHQLVALTELGIVGQITPALDNLMADAALTLGESTMAEIPQFSESGNPSIVPEFREHVAAHLDALRSMLATGVVADFGFVRRHAATRAEQRFPLEASLHSYRLGHRVIASATSWPRSTWRPREQWPRPMSIGVPSCSTFF